jgi:hypothetical protein
MFAMIFDTALSLANSRSGATSAGRSVSKCQNILQSGTLASSKPLETEHG